MTDLSTLSTVDLIRKLREGAKAVEAAGLPVETSIYKAAADTIERLQADLSEMTKDRDAWRRATVQTVHLVKDFR